jgi:C-terminal processing protease CtpA/Prc
MKKFRLFVLLISCLVILQGCDPGTSATDSDEITASEEKQFVWNGLNFWYFWQDRVADLADERKDNKSTFSRFLNGFDDERKLFDHLIFNQEDDFSWFIDDYEVHEAARVGTSKSFGFRFGLAQEYNSNNVFGYVQYVVGGSPADEAGLKRGNVFSGINGQNLTLSNYISLLNNEEYELRMASVRRFETGYLIQGSSETVQVRSEVLNENPIHTFRMYNFGSRTVGYLLYNAFRFNFHEELNNRFGTFKENGVNELVLDLRYNGGGALLTSALLASMISGENAGSVFAELRYNNKRSSNNVQVPYYDKVPRFDNSGSFIDDDIVLNTLRLSRVYILISSRTASASETVINGLRASGIEVVLIGTSTVGKDEGSITVYDAPRAQYSPGNNQRSMINPNHKRAMQPIVFKIFNSSGEDYPNGFAPSPGTTVQSEFNYLEDGLPPLGHPEEQLFKSALAHISGTFLAKEQAITEIDLSRYIMDSSELTPFHFDQYLLSSDWGRFSTDKE